MSTAKQNSKCAPFSLKLKQYISKLLTEGMEPDEIVKDLGLPEESVQSIVKLKFMNEKRMEFKKVAENWKNAANAAAPVAPEPAPKTVEVKKKKKSDDPKKKKGSSLEKRMVRKVERAMVDWLKNERDEGGLTLYNVLEKAEMLSNEVFTDKNYQRRGFKATEGWFRDFRKRNGLLKFRYAEEIERTEAKKMAKKLETVVPDFVWGECAGCDGTDCPVHEWISRPVKKKVSETTGSSDNPEAIATVESEPSQAPIEPLKEVVARNALPKVSPSALAAASPILSAQLQSSSVVEIANGVPTALVVNGKSIKVRPVPMEANENRESGSDSDSSSVLVIVGDDEEDEEMHESIVKAEEPTVMFLDDEQVKDKAEEEPVSSKRDNEVAMRKKKVKEAFDFFARGLSLLEEYDLFVQRRQTFCEGLHKLLDLYQLPEHV